MTEILDAALIDGPTELSLASGLPFPASGLAFLGVLNGDLYCAGSMHPSYTTGALAGLSRWRPSTGWVSLGTPASHPQANFNAFAEWGMATFKGSLYVGDRHAGNLYKWVLNGDGTLNDLVVAATIGGEDVFAGPVWMNHLWLGTFGRNYASPVLNPELWRYDGTTATRVIDLPDMGVAGLVVSMAVHGDHLYLSAITSNASACEVWRVDRSFAVQRIWTGAPTRRLISDGFNLFSLRVEYPDGNDNVYLDVWDGSGFVAVSDRLYIGQAVNTQGGIFYGRSLLVLATTNGVVEHDGAQTTAWTPLPGNGAMWPWSARVHHHHLWVVGNYPPAIWRRRLGLNRLSDAAGHPQKGR